MIKLTIPRLTLSLNDKQMKNRWTFSRLNQLWRDEVWLCLQRDHDIDKVGSRNPQTKKTRVTIVSYRKRLLDPDNYVAGCKNLIDALKYHNLIVDDSEKYMELVASQEHDGKNERTEIVIEEIKG